MPEHATEGLAEYRPSGVRASVLADEKSASMFEDLADLDPAHYTRLPVLNVASGVSLGIALLAATDASLPEAVSEAAVVVRERVVQLQARWAEQREAERQPSNNARPADIRLDRAWSAVGRRLEPLRSMAIPQAEQASALHSALFPTGLSFLTLAFAKQWAESQQRLDQIEQQGLTAALHQLVGEFVLDEVKAAHEAYGRVLGITDAKEAKAVPAKVAEALADLRDAMAVYCLQLVATAYAKPDTAPLIRKALRPVDDLRAALKRRTNAQGRDEGGSSDEPGAPDKPRSPDEPGSPGLPEVSPTTPVPELG
ncbi:MAG: hypothetical protein AAGF11_10720 [Myxococcota bacterium]